MPKYVALLRGIAPTNPQMRNENLRGVLEDLGLSNVETVISTGNVIFDSPSRAVRSLENRIEKAWPAKLGFTSTTIIRSKAELEKLVVADPFKGRTDSRASQFNVTFLKRPAKVDLKFPHRPKDRAYVLLGVHESAVCSVIDLTSDRTPDLMLWVEKQFGKEITTRTWKTVHRILKRMES